MFLTQYITIYDSELYYLSEDIPKKLNFPTSANFIGLHKNENLVALQSDWTINDKNYKQGSFVSFNLEENLSGNFNVKTIYEPDSKSSFVSASVSKDVVTISIMVNVQSKLIGYKFGNGKWIGKNLRVPDFASFNLVASDNQSNEYFFMYSNFITPTTLYSADENGMKTIKSLKRNFNTDNLIIEQFSATAKDVMAILYFVFHKKNMKLDGKNPTLIEAYGGFNTSFQPDYNSSRGLGWLEHGGVYVLANIRGGGEFATSWHQAAIKNMKQNSYDDFFLVSEDLISRKITNSKHLDAFGWSNGGLIIGVVLTQRPELYNAIVVGAPLLDMKRYSKMLAGVSWKGEYGNPDIPEEWDYIKKYSPYHNL